ncbi:MAG TPA: GntR family transcriptional regulator [Chloroflexota bacterium]|jgi:GntR family transcriptional regulator of arabinose operon
MLNVERVRRALRQPGTTPLHLRLRSAVREQVLDGTLEAGQALAAERTLQEQLGVSRSTVRQAIKSLVDEGLLQSVVGAGTFVVERRRVVRERDLVGVVVPDANFYLHHADLAASLGFRFREAGLRVDMSLHDERFETLHAVTRGLLEQNLAALVMVAPAGPNIDFIIAELVAQGVVVVLLARQLNSRLDLDLDSVSVDNQRIGYEATRHLLELGHTRIIHLPGTRTTTVRDRAIGYVTAMREMSLEPCMLLPPTEPGVIPDELEPYLTDPDPALLWAQVGRRDITAAFCFNDAIATWVQKEVRNLNLTIPRDLSLIAVDNMPYADFFDAPLTTFALPGKEIADEAASLVLRRLSGEDLAAQHVVIPARLMVRRSTAPPPRTGVVAQSLTRSK